MRCSPLRTVLAAFAFLLLAVPALAQGLSIDALVSRILADPNPQPYTMAADFTARMVFNMTTGRISVYAAGTLLESRAALGEPRRRKATLTRLDIPLLLRPFSSSIRRTVTDLVEAEPRPGEFLPTQDVFIVEERAGGRTLVGGVRQDIVTDTMTRYGQTANLRDPASRRAIARWLWSPTQRASIVRGGPGPYMLSALVDEAGLLYQLSLFYDWGELSNRFAFASVGGRPFWREVITDTSSEFMGLGRVDATIALQISNHCLNCPPR
ncbi:MAG: hypothetical protein FJX73_08695 [Armatimonadetes bacterium]|nr:hypothetical protein [Armatimonadota bacterium]